MQENIGAALQRHFSVGTIPLRLYVTTLSSANDSSAAHGLLRRGWADWQGSRPMPEISYGPYGKPDFLAAEHFSISHTKTMAVVALADVPVGVDCETIRPLRPAMAKRILAPGEQDQLARADDPTEMLLRFWTLKEAFVKMTGTGLRRVPNDLCFLLEGTSAKLAGYTNIVAESIIFENCAVAMCTESTKMDIIIKKM